MKESILNGESKDIVLDNISKLKELFPEVVTEDKINFKKLELILGEEIDDSKEKYSFTWPGKTQAIRESQKQSTGTLRPCREESKNWDTTQNLYIEGDNLEVLKLLQKCYYNKIKAIYIDPPYNTGKDFIYPDNYHDNLENYLKISGQVIESSEKERGFGVKLSTNTETNGRYHSDWLNMIYPRLKLARNLLKNDGVILISIDENEISNLTKLCSEIFGEENIIGSFIWNNRTAPNDANNNFAIIHEYILIVAKNAKTVSFKGIQKDLSNYTNPDNDPNGPWIKDNPSAASGSEKDRFVIKNPFTGQEYLPPKGRYWAFSQKRVKEWFESGKLVFPKEKNKNFILKKYVKELKSNFKPQGSIITDILTMHGTKEIRKIFADSPNVFKYPKPSMLIFYLLNQLNLENDIVLDFFSGSATTAHAVFNLSKNNKFILVQIPEIFDDKSIDRYKNICEIGKERIRRSGDVVIKESGNKDLDIGFKVFKLDSSNLEKWDPDYNDIQQSLTIDNIKEDRTNEDLVYEIMLKYGIDLTLPIEQKDNIYSIGFGALVICLDNNITKEITNEILNFTKDSSTSRVVFKDSGFASDADKTNIKEILKTNNIDEFITI